MRLLGIAASVVLLAGVHTTVDDVPRHPVADVQGTVVQASSDPLFLKEPFCKWWPSLCKKR